MATGQALIRLYITKKPLQKEEVYAKSEWHHTHSLFNRFYEFVWNALAASWPFSSSEELLWERPVLGTEGRDDVAMSNFGIRN